MYLSSAKLTPLWTCFCRRWIQRRPTPIRRTSSSTSSREWITLCSCQRLTGKRWLTPAAWMRILKQTTRSTVLFSDACALIGVWETPKTIHSLRLRKGFFFLFSSSLTFSQTVVLSNSFWLALSDKLRKCLFSWQFVSLTVFNFYVLTCEFFLFNVQNKLVSAGHILYETYVTKDSHSHQCALGTSLFIVKLLTASWHWFKYDFFLRNNL